DGITHCLGMQAGKAGGDLPPEGVAETAAGQQAAGAAPESLLDPRRAGLEAAEEGSLRPGGGAVGGAGTYPGFRRSGLPPRATAGPEAEQGAVVVLDPREGPGDDFRDSRSLVSLREPTAGQGIEDGGAHPGGGERPTSGREVAVQSQSRTVAEPFLGIGEQR